MSFWEILLLAVGVSMDAFAVSIGKGLSVQRASWREALTVGLWFGGFQALMPVIGYYLGISFADLVTKVDHWIAFGLLLLIGGNMIREALQPEDEKTADTSFGFKTMLVLAIATSIDALAVGISFACTGYHQLSQLTVPLLIIGIVSFFFSTFGYTLGTHFGKNIAKRLKPELLGGLILIAIGVKILTTHLLGVS